MPQTQTDYHRDASLLPPSANASMPNLLGLRVNTDFSPRLTPTGDYLCVTTGVQLGAVSDGADPKNPGIIIEEQSKIRPFSVVAR